MRYILITAIVFLSVHQLKAQEVLTKEQAIEIALKNNYDIQIVKNNVEIAKNNKEIYNSGYLPTVTGNAGANYSKNNTSSEFADGSVNEVNGAESRNYNASVGLNYTLFNGFNRQNTFKKLKETYNLSELQAQQVIENTLLTLFVAYYEVARLEENEANLKQTLEISKQRLKRAKYSLEYGQNTRLDVLNAEVDVNNDSISYLDVKRQLANSKRDLNLVLGREINLPVEVDNDLNFNIDLNLVDLEKNAVTSNVSLLQAVKNIELSKYDLKISKSGWMPNVALTSSYAWTKSNQDATTPFSPEGSSRTGTNAGLTMTWNLFDGGRTKTNVSNAKIAIDNQETLKEQQEITLRRDVNNAWETYQNSLFTLQVQEKNVSTNSRNFERSEELYKLGQITSIDFRQAQINLLNAKLNLSSAKYAAKNAELQLLQLSGTLLNNNNY